MAKVLTTTFWISLQGWYDNPSLINESSGECEILETTKIEVDEKHFYKEVNYFEGLYWAKDSCLDPFRSVEDIKEYLITQTKNEIDELDKKILKLEQKKKVYQNYTTKLKKLPNS